MAKTVSDRVIVFDTVDFDGAIVSGKGSSTDVLEASARAYLGAVNRFMRPVVLPRVSEAGP